MDTIPDAEILLLYNIPEQEREKFVQFSSTRRFLTKKRSRSKSSCKREVTINQQMAEISLTLLGATLSDGSKARWVRPSAVHKARFMAFSNCTFKCYNLFSTEMQYSPGVIDLPRRLATFLVTIYHPHFLMCSRGVVAAINDWELAKNRKI